MRPFTTDARWFQICNVPSKSDPSKKYDIKVDRSRTASQGRLVLSCGCTAWRFNRSHTTDGERDCKHLPEVRRRILADEKFRNKIERELGLFIDEGKGGLNENFAVSNRPITKHGAVVNPKVAVTVAVDTISNCPICHSENNCGDEIVTCPCGVEYINPNL